MKIDKRKLKRQTRNHLKEMGWSSSEAHKESEKIIKQEIKKFKYVTEFTKFLRDHNLNTFRLICRTENGTEEVNFSILDISKKVNINEKPDIILTNKKENANEIDIRYLRMPSHHASAGLMNKVFEEDRAKDPRYMIQMIYHTFMFSIQDDSFNTLKYLKQEYLNIKE